MFKSLSSKLKEKLSKLGNKDDPKPKLYQCNYSVRVKNLNGQEESISVLLPLAKESVNGHSFRPEPDAKLKDKASKAEFAYWKITLPSHHSTTLNQFFQLFTADPDSFTFQSGKPLELKHRDKNLKVLDPSEATVLPEIGNLDHFRIEKEFSFRAVNKRQV